MTPIPPPRGPWALAVVSSTDDDTERFVVLSDGKPIMRTEGDTTDDAVNALLATAAPTMLIALYSAQTELEDAAVTSGKRSEALALVEHAIDMAIWSDVIEVRGEEKTD